MPAGRLGSAAPPGFVSFCERTPDQCLPSASTALSVDLDSGAWNEITRINLQVNNAVTPASDEKHYGREEYWTVVTDGKGDCEDYALTKRKELIDAGLPEPALRLAVVVTLRGEQHVVLTVKTDRGDFVLDNLTNDLLAWNQTGYAWLARQDAGGKLGWVAFNDDSQQILSATTNAN